jgi:ribosomal protein S18 acetylase RimI-like enzyme
MRRVTMNSFSFREATADDASAVARVHVESWRSTYAGILPAEAIAERSFERRHSYWCGAVGRSGAEYVYVAETGGLVVGLASGGPERSGDSTYRGELYAIYILAEYQRRGIGRELVRAIAERLSQDELSGMLVWVLADNPARTFYTNLGGKELRRQPIWFGSVTVDEVAYGWQDTTGLRVER